ncbi:hypothetical protein LEP1GSC123_4138 [Leptospira borgpetersenii str. 200701203]|uniref:Uncharacterized protein n=1 Tax=Leptospira borgpetersenii str. 200701203 TaxID=1193007 RepID=M3F799_LEPBO|nr:hypothetical protein LEP1GSC123_4138 [Leptospira borgpetersenii str. 200701203]
MLDYPEKLPMSEKSFRSLVLFSKRELRRTSETSLRKNQRSIFGDSFFRETRKIQQLELGPFASSSWSREIILRFYE